MPLTTKVSTKAEEKEIIYPCLRHLRTNPNLIVLFSSKNSGTIVQATSESHPVGKHIELWDVINFVKFVGTLHLTQD